KAPGSPASTLTATNSARCSSLTTEDASPSTATPPTSSPPSSQAPPVESPFRFSGRGQQGPPEGRNRRFVPRRYLSLLALVFAGRLGECADEKRPRLDRCGRDAVRTLPWVGSESLDDLGLVGGVGDEQDADPAAVGARERSGEEDEALVGESVHEGCVVGQTWLVEGALAFRPPRTCFPVHGEQTHRSLPSIVTAGWHEWSTQPIRIRRRRRSRGRPSWLGARPRRRHCRRDRALGASSP